MKVGCFHKRELNNVSTSIPGMGGAAIPLSTPSSSLSPALLLPTPAFSAGRTKALSAVCFKQHYAPSFSCRSQLPSLSEPKSQQVVSKNSPTLASLDNETAVGFRLLQNCQEVVTTASLGASFLMVNLPANAEMVPDIPASDLITPEMVPEILENIFLALTMAILYFFVAPLCVYYYLYKRWFKRKMAEAILQFGLVFFFFPGMLLLGPFINFRGAPQEGAKEPWDEIRPSSSD